MSILEQKDKILEVLERAGHNLNLEFFGNLLHNVRYKVDYHLISARVKYYSNSKNPRVIQTKLNNSHLVSLRTHPNQRYVVRTGEFLQLGPEDTINDILQYYQASLRNLETFFAKEGNSPIEEPSHCKSGKLVSLDSESEAARGEKLDVFADFDSNGDEPLESTPPGQNSSALCKESTTSNSTFQLTTASLRFDEHLRGMTEPKRRGSLKLLKKEIMSRFGSDSPESVSSKKGKRRLSIIRRKTPQQPQEQEPGSEEKFEPQKLPKMILTDDINLIELSDSESLPGEPRMKEVGTEEQAQNEIESRKMQPEQVGVTESFKFSNRPKKDSQIKVKTKQHFRVKDQASEKDSLRFYEKLAKQEKAKPSWNMVYNDIAVSAARLSTGSEGTSRDDYESLKSDLTDSRRKVRDMFADNLRQGKAKFHSSTQV